ncbi:hypothetical protein K1T71_009398 [Dendrolimus kikuchii]|uniref:Uncharacterized protein n=1 Tax=Dendrolimus kikuchii TaxID=765133 RepID=A0ACC1CVG3_9NEOP|nr:hypothetical protein K1T71_009398 [Dendrolimus kikuchii]
MAASSIRGLRLIKSLERYAAETKNFDSTVILNNMKFAAASDGFLKGTFTVERGMCNAAGYAHGGCMASFIDSLSFISHMTYPNGKIGWTTNMTVNFLMAAKIGEQISVEAQLIKLGKISVCETTLKNQAGVLLVKGITTFSVGADDIDDFVKRAMYIEDEKSNGNLKKGGK